MLRYLFIYTIFMKNILLTLILLSAAVLPLQAKDPFFLYDSGVFKHPLLIEETAQKKPITYLAMSRIDGEERKLLQEEEPVSVVEAYNAWFKNTLKYINENNKEQFAFMIDVLEFGASPEAIIRDTEDEWQNLVVFFVDKDDKHFIKTVGSFPSGFFRAHLSNIIHIREPYYNESHVLIHEFGHALNIADSYDGAITQNAIQYGTNPRGSIMNHNHFGKDELTCDDADAVVNTVWSFMKKANPNTPDLKHDSFCKAKDGEKQLQFKNRMQLDREPLHYYRAGRLMNNYFCKEGGLKSTATIDPHEPEDIKTEIKNENCSAIEFEKFAGINLPENAENNSAKLIDLLNTTESRVKTDKNTVIYEYAPYFLRETSFNSNNIPVMVKVTNDTALFYVYAIIDENYAYVLSNDRIVTFVYNMKKPELYFLQKGYKKQTKCTMSQADCKNAEEIIKRMDGILEDDRKFGYDDSGRLKYNIKMGDYLAQAVRWQNYISKNYPYADFKIKTMKTDSKSFKELIKQVSFKSPF